MHALWAAQLPGEKKMLNKIGLLTSFLILTTGCTEAKYVQYPETGLDSKSVQEKKVDCELTFSKSQLCLIWYWEKRPTSREQGQLVFKTYRLNLMDETPIEIDMPQMPELLLWMPSMGHGSTPTQTERIDIGTYRAKNVFFVMPGEWELKFQIKSGTEILDEAIALITL